MATGIGSTVTAAPRSFARYSRRNRVPAGLLLFGLAAGLAWLRRGRLPERRELGAFLIAAVIIVVAASLVPDLVVGILTGLLLLLAVDESDRLAQLADALMRNLGSGPVVSRWTGGGVPQGA